MDDFQSKIQKALGKRYEIKRQIGRGGFSRVFLARDHLLNIDVAIKGLIRRDAGYAPTFGDSTGATMDSVNDYHTMFLKEARIVAGLTHPNIVRVFEAGENADLAWIIMLYVDGETLTQRMKRVPNPPLPWIMDVLHKTAQALSRAHARGIIHRDVKPDNILIESGTDNVYVTDFGLAKWEVDDRVGMDSTGELRGTLPFMSPEQALGDEADVRSDIYSLGLVAYYLLTGEQAIKGQNRAEFQRFHFERRTVPLDTFKYPIPMTLRDALQKALDPDPVNRFQRMDEFGEALLFVEARQKTMPPTVQNLFWHMKLSFLTITIGLMVLGFVGYERVHPSFRVLAGGLVMLNGLAAFERARRKGVTWTMVRNGLCLERAERLAESREPAGVGVFTIAASALVVLAAVMLGAPDPEFRLANLALLSAGSFGILVTLLLFHRLETNRFAAAVFARRSLKFALLSIPLALAIGSMVAFRPADGSVPWQELGLVIVALGWGGFLLEVRGAHWHLPEDEPSSWWIPYWLDVTGSWMFARFLPRWPFLKRTCRPVAINSVEGIAREMRRLRRTSERLARKRLGDVSYARRQYLDHVNGILNRLGGETNALRQQIFRAIQLNHGLTFSTEESKQRPALAEELQDVRLRLETIRNRIHAGMELLEGMIASLESDDFPGLSQQMLDAAEWSRERVRARA